LLLLILFIQYRVAIFIHGRKNQIGDEKANIAELSVIQAIRTNAVAHAANTCVNYMMFVWAVVFTKAFQGLHCIYRGGLVLAQDLGMVCTLYYF